MLCKLKIKKGKLEEKKNEKSKEFENETKE